MNFIIGLIVGIFIGASIGFFTGTWILANKKQILTSYLKGEDI